MIDLLDAVDTFLAEAAVSRKDRVQARIRPSTQRALAAAFRKQGLVFIRKLFKLRDEWPVIEAHALQRTFPGWEQAWYEAAAETAGDFENPIVRAEKFSLKAGGNALYRDMMLVGAFDLENPLAVKYIYDHGAKMVTGVNHTTQGYLRTIIGEGLEKGWSYDRLAEALLDRFDEFAVGRPQLHIDSRAHGIAVTEIGNAYEAGNAIVANDLKQTGLTMEKSWLTVNDDRVDIEECMGNQDQGWIPLDEAFQSGDMQPLAHPYCRCTALYRRQRE